VDADIATIVTPGEDGELRIAVAEGERDGGGLEGMEVPLERSLSGQVLHSGRSVVVDNAAKAEGVYQPMIAKAGAGPMIFAPLSVRGRAFGTLAVGNRMGRPRFSAQDVSLLETFADQASLVLEYGRIQRELSRLALVEDRERIAKDLHDGVIQSLFAVGLGLQGAAGLIADPNAAHRLNEAVAEIDRVIGDLRGYIFGLRPAVLAAGRLTDALSQLCHEFEQRSGITSVVEIDPSLEEPLAAVAIDIVQLVREALSNVERHSGAATCRVSLRREGQAAMLEIDDDGKGFEPSTSTAGMGLSNLRERAASMGAQLRIESSGSGTTVAIAIPLTD
jgi:signal transduction histidine kinase